MIRPVALNDYPSIFDIYAQSKLDELINEKKQFVLLPLNEDKKRLTELQQSNIYVYVDNGVVAYGAVYESEIRALFVHPSKRGKGIGKALMVFLLNTITSSQNTNTVTLHVANSNETAQSLYRRFGFKVVNTFETDYNGAAVMACKMEKNLN